MKRYGPSRRRALDASAALRIFVRHPEKTFATISARTGPQAMSAIWSLTGGKRTSRRQPNSVAIDPERKSRVINVQGRSEPKPKRFMISRRFVDYLFRGVINYDRRFEILELG